MTRTIAKSKPHAPSRVTGARAGSVKAKKPLLV
jgi:hypothetical protein